MKSRNILEVTDFTQKEWKRRIKEAIAFKKNTKRKDTLLQGKRVGMLFDSNSLRTRISFESACYLLGGDSYFIDLHQVTHEKDGTHRESYEDIIDTLDRLVDAYVLRDYSQELLHVLQRKNDPPVINGFCQVGHPSQALADFSVITWKKGTYEGLQYVGVCPSAGSGVMESFVYAALLLGQQITLITPTGEIVGKNHDFHEVVDGLCKTYGGSLQVTKDIIAPLSTADVLYVDEWWENKKDYLDQHMGAYRVDERFLKGSKPSLSILHALPAHAGREIGERILRSPQSIIFDEAEFRVYSAMSLLSFLLG